MKISESQTGPANRRAVPRLDRQGHSWSLFVNNDTLITRNVLDVSAGGIAFKAPASLNFVEGQFLNLHVQLDNDNGWDCEGQVMWKRRDSGSSMTLFGVRLLRVPAWAEIKIFKWLNDRVLSERRELLAQGLKPQFSYRALKISMASAKAKEWVMAILSFLALLAVVSSLLTAAAIHQQRHPEDSIENIFNRGLNARARAQEP